MIRVRSAALVLMLVACAGPGLAGVVTFDPMTAELTPNDCLPVTTPRVATWGAWCDAPSCPPGTVSPETDCQCGDQPSFGSELIGPYRTTYVWAPDYSTSVHARIDPVAQRMVLVTSGGLPADLIVLYSDSDHDLWEGDLIALGAIAIEVVVDGDVSASNPLFLTIDIGTRSNLPGVGSGGQITSRVRLDSPGTYRFPFESFTQDPPEWPYPPDLHRVVLMLFSLSQCPDTICDGRGYPAASYSLGPITLITAEPTLTQRSSWSKVKQIYR